MVSASLRSDQSGDFTLGAVGIAPFGSAGDNGNGDTAGTTESSESGAVPQSKVASKVSAQYACDLLVAELLGAASSRMGGGSAGAARLREATIVLSLPGCLSDPVRGALLLGCMDSTVASGAWDFAASPGLVARARAGQATAAELATHTERSRTWAALHQSTKPGGKAKGAWGARGGDDGDDDGAADCAVVVGFIDDARAAALAAQETGLFGSDPESRSSSSLPAAPFLVVDVGALLTQATVLQVPTGGSPTEGFPCGYPEVLSSHFARGVGAGALSFALAEHIARKFDEKHPGSGGGVFSDYLARVRLMDAAEDACLNLSSSATASINLPYIAVDFATMEPRHLECSMSRSLFSALSSRALDAIAEPALDALREHAALSGDNQRGGGGGVIRSGCLGTVLLVGGGARSPTIRRALEEKLTAALASSSSSPSPLTFLVPDAPEEANVIGAALAAKHGWVS